MGGRSGLESVPACALWLEHGSVVHTPAYSTTLTENHTKPGSHASGGKLVSGSSQMRQVA